MGPRALSLSFPTSFYLLPDGSRGGARVRDAGAGPANSGRLLREEGFRQARGRAPRSGKAKGATGRECGDHCGSEQRRAPARARAAPAVSGRGEDTDWFLEGCRIRPEGEPAPRRATTTAPHDGRGQRAAAIGARGYTDSGDEGEGWGGSSGSGVSSGGGMREGGALPRPNFVGGRRRPWRRWGGEEELRGSGERLGRGSRGWWSSR